MALLCPKLLVEEIDIALIQEPLVCGDRINGLCYRKGTLFSEGSYIARRSCICVRNTVHTFLLSELSCRDVMTVRVMCTKEGSNWELTVISAYLCCGSDFPPLTNGLRDAIDSCSRNKMRLIFGCGAKACHIIWWSMDIILLGESLMHCLVGT